MRPARDPEDQEGHHRHGDGQNDRPAEVGEVRAVERRQLQGGDRDRGGAEPGPGAHPDPDQRADAGCQEARNEDDLQLRATQARGLDQDQRGDQRRPEEERHRRERRRGPDDLGRLRRRVGSEEADAQDPQAAADRDQRGLRAYDGTEGDRGHACEHDARERARHRGGGVQAIGRDVAAVSGQAGDREGDDHTGDREHRNRPPEWGAVESQSVRGGRCRSTSPDERSARGSPRRPPTRRHRSAPRAPAGRGTRGSASSPSGPVRTPPGEG